MIYRENRPLLAWSGPAGDVCSSYAAETVTMSRAVDWLRDRAEELRTAVVVTDSRSLLDGLSGAGGDLRELRDKLWTLHEGNKTVTLVWVPGHCGLPGNEEADRLAGQGSELDQARRAQLRRQIVAEDPVFH